MFNIKLTSSAKRELKNLSKVHKKATVILIEELKEDPTLGKPLGRGLAGKFSFRVGVNRVVYKINQKDKTVLVLRVGHRGKVYG